MKKPTLKEKYDWLCAKFRVHDIDFWERDALLSPIVATGIYFQIAAHEDPAITVDRAIILSMQQQRS